jgi:excisionase family DNA binding protein
MMVGLLDQDGAAAYLSTSGRRVSELRRAGQILAVKDGVEWKFKPADLDAYIDSLPTSAELR